MKKIFLPLALLLILALPSKSQVQVDKQIQLTGSNTDAIVTGIKRVTSNQDAVSTDYLQRDSLKFALATGTSNAYSVNLSPPVTSQYTVGMVVLFRANFANTGPATLNINSLGADTIMKNYNNYLAANDIQNGQMVIVMYDGQYFQMLSQLGNTSVAAPHGKQRFFSNGTFTVPSGVTTIWVSMSGGGGGGGGGSSYDGTWSGGGGGGAEALIDSAITVVPGSIYTITIGAGGTGGTGESVDGDLGASGNPGGNSSLDNVLIAYGGGGGGGGMWYPGNPGAAGGTGGASGGASFFCAAGAGYGCGGAGGSGSGTGSTGSPGFAIIEW